MRAASEGWVAQHKAQLYWPTDGVLIHKKSSFGRYLLRQIVRRLPLDLPPLPIDRIEHQQPKKPALETFNRQQPVVEVVHVWVGVFAPDRKPSPTADYFIGFRLIGVILCHFATFFLDPRVLLKRHDQTPTLEHQVQPVLRV